MYYVVRFGQWDDPKPVETVTIDAALMVAERLSKYPLVGTESIYERYAVITRERHGSGTTWKVHAIALMGKAKWVAFCGHFCTSYCTKCLGCGWKETGEDRG